MQTKYFLNAYDSHYSLTTWWPLGDHLVTTWWPLGYHLMTTCGAYFCPIGRIWVPLLYHSVMDLSFLQALMKLLNLQCWRSKATMSLPRDPLLCAKVQAQGVSKKLTGRLHLCWKKCIGHRIFCTGGTVYLQLHWPSFCPTLLYSRLWLQSPLLQ